MGIFTDYDYENTYHSHTAWYTPTHVPLTTTTILPPKSYSDRISRLILTLNTISSLRSHLLHPFQPRDPETLSPLSSPHQNTLNALNQLLHWETLGADGTIVNKNGPIVEIRKVLSWAYIQSGPQEREEMEEIEQLLGKGELLTERVWRAFGYVGEVVGESDFVTGWAGRESARWRPEAEGQELEEKEEWEGLFGEVSKPPALVNVMNLIDKKIARRARKDNEGDSVKGGDVRRTSWVQVIGCIDFAVFQSEFRAFLDELSVCNSGNDYDE